MSEVICDSKRLIYSNRICCISNESICLNIDLTDKDIINIVFNFHYDGNEVKTTMNSPENGKIVFDLTNYVSSLGTGVTKPVKIAVLDGKNIYVLFNIYRLDKTTFPILDISVYMEV